MPRDFDRNTLAHTLRHHPDLQSAQEERPQNGDKSGNSISVYTLAPDLRLHEQTATVRFHNLPGQLETLKHRDQLTIDVKTSPEDPLDGDKQLVEFIQIIRMTIDEHFDGVTTLISPSVDKEHRVDVLAVPGLGSHPFGSFMHKRDGNMWLADSLPRDMPAARVMIYGYESRLQDSNSLVQLDDLAGPLHMVVHELLHSEKRTPLLLIGHSLGGLLVKEALIRIGELNSEAALLSMIHGVLLFGTPNDGMDIESLVPLVNDQPNRFLLESLNTMNSQILSLQKKGFTRVLQHTKCQLFCFYETEKSPTAAKANAPCSAQSSSTNVIIGSKKWTL